MLQLTKSEFKEKTRLFLRKGVIPYDYLTDFSKFAEKSFPLKETLYSKLSDCDVEDKNYEHAQRVENLGDNHDVYLRSDRLLFADVFGISRLLVWPGMQL